MGTMAAPEMDTVVRGGTVVTAGGRGTADLGIRDGRVAQLGGAMRGRAELDARDHLVLPGAVDPHVHLSTPEVLEREEPAFVDDFWTGSLAAIGGGVLTLGQMSFPDNDDQGLLEPLARDEAAAVRDAAVDWFLHPSMVTAGAATTEEIEQVAALGHRSLKVVMPAFDFPGGHGPALVQAIAAAAEAGLVVMVHCEDEALISHLTSSQHRAGVDLAGYPGTRPPVTERAAVERAVAIGEVTGATIDVVHLSSADALAITRAATARGVAVQVETRPMYLHLDAELHHRADGAKYVGMPPLRAESDREALWRGLVDGSVHTIGSDHAPWTLAHKLDPQHTLATVPKGMAELDTFMPMLFDRGVTTGRITLEQLVAVTSTRAAQLFGLYPRKGTLAIGADADVVVLDPRETRVVDGRELGSAAGWSPYDGQTVSGWPRHVLSRGELVLSDREILARRGHGRNARDSAKTSPGTSRTNDTAHTNDAATSSYTASSTRQGESS